MSPFNHQVGTCGADVTAPDETHHLCGHRGGKCVPPGLRCIEATLKRPGGPQEELVLTSFKGKASPWGWPCGLPPQEIFRTKCPARAFPSRPPQAFHTWDLAESIRPNYWAGSGQVHGDPSSHWADSSPRAHDGHACGERAHVKRHGPKVSGRPRTRGE